MVVHTRSTAGLLAAPAPGLITPVAVNSASGILTGSGPTGVASNVTLPAGAAVVLASGTHRALLVAVIYDGPSTTLPVAPYTVTWDQGGTNQAMTQVAFLDDGSAGSNHNADQISWWGLLNPTTGSKQINLTWGGGVTIQYDVCGISFNNVDQSSIANAFQGATTNSPGTSNTTSSITVSSFANAICCCLTTQNFAATNPNPTSPNHTQIWAAANSNNGSLGQYAAGAGSITFTTAIGASAVTWNNAAISVMPG